MLATSAFLFAAVAALGALAIRLLLLGRRSGQLPERLIGAFFALFATMLLVRAAGTLVPGWMDGATVTGHLLFGAATVVLTVFTWRVFRPDSAAACFFVVTTCTLLGGAYGARIVLGEGHALAKLAVSVVRLLPFGWAFFECSGYWLRMRRRQRLGLGDPVVTNRFLLWSIWTGAITFLPLFSVITRAFLFAITGTTDSYDTTDGQVSSQLSGLALLIGAIGSAASVSLWLAFFPPDAYLKRLQARASNGA